MPSNTPVASPATSFNQSPTAGLAQLLATLAPIFLGSGTVRGNEQQQVTSSKAGGTIGTNVTQQNQTGQDTTSGVTTTTPNVPPEILMALLGRIADANKNANNPSAVQDVVNNIIRTNLQAFAPTLGDQAASGLYNGSTVKLLAGEAAARSSAQTSKTVLDYKNEQQTLAANLTANLASLLRSTTSTTTGATNKVSESTNVGSTSGQTQESGASNIVGSNTKVQDPLIGGSSSGNLASIVGLVAALGGKKLLTDTLGGSNEMLSGITDFLGFTAKDATGIWDQGSSALDTNAIWDLVTSSANP